MSTKIKSTLFRFISMRAPELSDETKQEKGFVFRGKTVAKGVFDTAISSKTSSETKMQALKTASQNFNPLSLEAIKQIDKELYTLSIWVAKNRNFFTEEELHSKIEGVKPITDNKILGQLWDNLFYQTITQEAFYEKETIIQLLITNHFVSNYKPVDLELAKTLLSARVVLPKALFVESAKTSQSSAKKAAQTEDVVASFPMEEMVKQQIIGKAELHNEALNKLSKELAKVEKTYRKEYNEALSQAEKAYQETVNPIIEDYEQKVEDEKQKWCSIRDPQVEYNPDDPCNKPPVVPRPKLPEFNFSFKKQLDYKFIQSKLSTDSFNTLLELVGTTNDLENVELAKKDETSYDVIIDNFEDYDDLNTAISNQITSNNQDIVNNTTTQQNAQVSIGGVTVPVQTTTQLKPFLFQLCSKLIKKGMNSAYNSDLIIAVPDSTYTIANFSYTIERTDTNFVSNNLTNNYVLSRIGNHISLKNINIGLPLITDDPKLVSFTGRITFTNGIVKEFKVTNFTLTACATGLLKTVQVTTPGNTNTPTTPNTPTEDVPFVPSGFGVKQLGIADYNKVEQTTQSYIEGDVAHIENIMAREFKERSTRRLRKKEDTFTSSSESEREQLTDTTSTNRFEMQSEVAKLIAESKDTSAGVSASASYASSPKTTINIGANASFATHNSKEESTQQAVTTSKELTERALDRIVSKVKEERIEKIVEEFEENNTHGFDNRKGDKHVVGVFRWVDKVFKNQIINYGKRLMFEFMVPEPAKLHKLGMSESIKDTILVKPIDPRVAEEIPILKLENYSQLTEEKLKYWASLYNVEFDQSKKDTIKISKAFKVEFADYDQEGNSLNENIEIPEGYTTKSAILGGSYYHHGNSDNGKKMSISIGNNSFSYNNHTTVFNETIYDNDFKGIKNKLAVSASTFDVLSASFNLTVTCSLTPEAKKQWQQEAFKAIIDGYEKALAKYKEDLAAEQAKGIEIKGTNPSFYREFENKILRKNCISYLIDQNTEAKNTYGKDNLFFTNNGANTFSFGNTEVSVNQELDNYAAFVKFMEQAFEWDIMSYNLYPYYWGNRKDWSDLYNYDATNDPLFRNFMQAGMARVVVTVRPGFEEAVRYYMQTGNIWNGGEIPVIEDELYLSIVDELRQPEGEKLGKAWPTRVPTALTVLQAQSIGLKVEKALPGNDDLSDFENPDDVPQSSQLQLNDAEIGIAESDGERHIENIDIVNGKLQLNTDDNPRQVVAQISIQALKNAIDEV